MYVYFFLDIKEIFLFEANLAGVENMTYENDAHPEEGILHHLSPTFDIDWYDIRIHTV